MEDLYRSCQVAGHGALGGWHWPYFGPRMPKQVRDRGGNGVAVRRCATRMSYFYTTAWRAPRMKWRRARIGLGFVGDFFGEVGMQCIEEKGD